MLLAARATNSPTVPLNMTLTVWVISTATAVMTMPAGGFGPHAH